MLRISPIYQPGNLYARYRCLRAHTAAARATNGYLLYARYLCSRDALGLKAKRGDRVSCIQGCLLIEYNLNICNITRCFWSRAHVRPMLLCSSLSNCARHDDIIGYISHTITCPNQRPILRARAPSFLSSYFAYIREMHLVR